MHVCQVINFVFHSLLVSLMWLCKSHTVYTGVDIGRNTVTAGFLNWKASKSSYGMINLLAGVVLKIITVVKNNGDWHFNIEHSSWESSDFSWKVAKQQYNLTPYKPLTDTSDFKPFAMKRGCYAIATPIKSELSIMPHHDSTYLQFPLHVLVT